jgi:hypothetical protein
MGNVKTLDGRHNMGHGGPKINPHIDPLDVERQRQVGQLRARRAASLAARVAAGDPLAIAMQAAEQAAQERAEAEQQWRDRREAARLRHLLGLDDVEAALPRKPITIPDSIKPDTPLTLEEAVSLAFPTGIMTVCRACATKSEKATWKRRKWQDESSRRWPASQG